MFEKFLFALSDCYHEDLDKPGIFIWHNGTDYSATVRRMEKDNWYTIGSGSGKTVQECVKNLAKDWIKITFPKKGIIDLFNILSCSDDKID